MTVAIIALALVICDRASADIPVPDPQTQWARGQVPSQRSIMIGGASISVAVIAAGLLFALSPIGPAAGEQTTAPDRASGGSPADAGADVPYQTSR
jgi:hypothetical protein